MSLWATILTGVASSFVAALVFLAFTHCIRPKLEIGRNISRRPLANGGNEYAIKVVNRAYRGAIDLYPRLQIVHVTFPAGGHHLMTVEPVTLKTTHFFFLRGYRKRDQDGQYAVRFASTEDLDAKWVDRNHSYVRFLLKATDRLSGVTDIFEMHFRGNDSIKDGQFKTGRSTEIG